MAEPGRGFGRVSGFLRAHFLGLLLAGYVVAAVWPGPGLALRGVKFGRASLGKDGVTITLPAVMLGFLLVNAGLGVKLGELRGLAGRPKLLGAGLGANLLIPVAFVFGVSLVLRAFPDVGEVQAILVGLAMVAAMPIAGSSTAWAQNADGDLPLSLGLVVASTAISPVATPLALHAIGFMAEGGAADELHGLADHGSGLFLVLCVVAPALLGIGLRWALGDARAGAIGPYLKLANSVVLLTLSYSNAAVALPRAFDHPDWGFLGLVLAVTSAFCVLSFGSGWAIARGLASPPPSRVSLIFGLGLSNNGTGLVLASMVLGDQPRALLPIVVYNLVQQVGAGVVGAIERRDHAEG